MCIAENESCSADAYDGSGAKVASLLCQTNHLLESHCCTAYTRQQQMIKLDTASLGPSCLRLLAIQQSEDQDRRKVLTLIHATSTDWRAYRI